MPTRSVRFIAASLLSLTGALLAVPAVAEDAPTVDPISVEALLNVVVSPTLREQAMLDAPVSIQVITADEIEERGYLTIKEMMNDVAGFADVSDVNEEVAAVRGVFATTTNKILILVDGHRMNDLMLGRYNTDQFLGVDAIERVEFIRGPASALYGTGALVGIVNIVTGRARTGAQVKIRGGPYRRALSASWGRALGGFEIFANFSLLDAPGQEREQPARLDVVPENSGQVRAPGAIYLGRYPQNLSGLVTVRSDNARLALRGAHFRRVPPRGASGSYYVYELEPFKPAYTENDFFVDYQYDWRLGDAGRISFNPSLHFFSYYEQSFINFGANRKPLLGERSGMQGEFNNYQLKVTFERQLLPELNFIAGFDGLLASFFRSDAVTIEQPPLAITQAGGLRNGLEVQVPPRAQRVVIRPNGYSELGKWFLGGAFGQAVWSPAPPLTLTLGARFDSYGREADPEITPRVGIVYKPLESAAVKLLYGRSYLAPMWAHRRANDGNFLGNPDLDPETFEGYGLVFAYATARLSGSLDFFYNRVSNLINAIEQCGSALYNYQNIGESLYMGAELEAKAQATTWLGLRGSYSFIFPGRDPPRPPPRDPAHPRPTGSCPPEPEAPRLVAGGHIRDIPRHTFRYGLRLEPAAGLSLSVWGRATSWTLVEDMVENQRVLPNLLDERYTRLPPVALLDASVSYAWRQWQFQLVGTNLTNRYYERGGTEARPLARMGISVEAVVTWRP